MKRFYTAESVTEGHPDKLCDLIADSILDACLKEDENSRVACEVLATKGNIIVAGEITSRYEPQVFEIVRKVLESAGYEADGIHMDALIHKQSPDIAGAVERSRERRTGTVSVQSGLANGAGDQGIMVGYACDDTPQLMPMPVVLANRIVRELSASRRSGYIMGILPDGKAQVTVEYEDDRPVRLDTVVVSCQHEKEKSLRKLEHEIREKVLRPALRMLPPDEDTKILINPSGRFVCGGLDADTGLTGRKLMVDTYGGLVPHGGGAFSGKDCSKVDRSGAYMARYIAKNMVAAGLANRCQVSLGYFMCADKRIHIGDRMKYMPMGYFNSHSLGNLTSTVTTTISDVENNAPSVLITVIHGFIHVTVITIVMFFFDWRIGLLACLGIALFLLCNSVLQKKSQEVSPKRQAAQEDLVGTTLEYIQGMGIVKSFNLGGKSNQKMKQAIEESRARNTKLETVFGPYGMVQLFVLRLASVAIMFCSILFYLQGSMTLVYCLLMCVASFLIFSELEAAGGKSFALRLIESSIDKVNAIDDTPVMDLSGKDIAPKDTTIELQNVGFSYGDHRILNHVNLTIPAKTTTAIVGPSGSGKTTLCSLITRFWDVDEGCIKLGGTDIREYKLDSLLSNISMVFQNVFLFADSIENNIKFGKPDATHEEVVRAAKSACCHDFIMALPNGYDTVIGESGATLSGGEKQRISIARAILKDTPIIILDEATSSVDPENEAELQQAIEKLTEDKTVIIIAHRLKTVRNAQQIVVIANGGIAQRGTHQELMTQPGIYADFVNIREKAVNWKISSSKIQQ